jgi:hypothetical protein
VWYKSLEAEGIDVLSNIVLTHDSEIFGAGSKPNSLSLIKISSNNGSIIWENNKQSDPIIREIQATSDAGFILTGNLFVGSGNKDGFIFKTDLNGN